MVQGYYTLPEAAKVLNMPVDELKHMAQKGQIRSFQDRGTLRFRIQDIQELARSRGGSSDPDLVLGDASLPPPKSAATPPSGTRKSQGSPKSPPKQQAAPDVFAFDMDADSVDLGADLPGPGSGVKPRPPASKAKKGPPSPAPVGSDSDVRLIADGSDVTFSVPKSATPRPPDSDVKIPSDPVKPNQPPSSARRAAQMAVGSDVLPKPKSGAGAAQSPRPGTTPQPADSGVRLVPLDSDSDVKLVGASDDVPLGLSTMSSPSDSNVRLDKVPPPPADSAESNLMLTDEIDLDAEIKRQEEKAKKEPSTKLKAKSELKLPTSSAFELSDSEVPVPPELHGRGGPKTPRQAKSAPGDSSEMDLPAASSEGSSDFDLVPAGGGLSLDGDSKDFSLDIGDSNEQVLQDDSTTELTKSTSGISLNNPVDAGISLEDDDKGSDSVDFDLSLDAEDTPKPSKNKAIDDSGFEVTGMKTPKPKKSKDHEVAGSSEFELSLEEDSDSHAPALSESGDSDSHFELNLDGSDEGSAAATDADSEFELTLDDSGQLQSDDAKPQVKAKGGESSGDQDIFETDFEVPALDDSDDATIADSELESSDFDLALDDSELANEEESGSQVVALDEEDQTTAADSDDAAVVDDADVEAESSDFSALDEDVEVDDEDAVDVEVDDEEGAPAGKTRVVVKEKLIPPAPWGVMPVVFMLPCVIVMIMVGMLGFELVQSTAALKPPGPLTLLLAETFGQKVSLPKN